MSEQTAENDVPCRFARLREHTPSECPLCNPTDWMARVAPPASPDPR